MNVKKYFFPIVCFTFFQSGGWIFCIDFLFSFVSFILFLFQIIAPNRNAMITCCFFLFYSRIKRFGQHAVGSVYCYGVWVDQTTEIRRQRCLVTKIFRVTLPLYLGPTYDLTWNCTLVLHTIYHVHADGWSNSEGSRLLRRTYFYIVCLFLLARPFRISFCQICRSTHWVEHVYVCCHCRFRKSFNVLFMKEWPCFC